MADIHIALAGVKNSGKSALFNALTGQRTHVGNYPGVTTEHTHACLKSQFGQISEGEIHVIDMPGMSSLTAYSLEEEEALDLLLHDPPNVIVNVIDTGHVAQGLYLALQLTQLNIPLILAFTMMDELADGAYVDVEALSRALGIPAVAVSVPQGRGVSELARAALRACGVSTARASKALNRTPIRFIDYCEGSLHKALHSIAHIVEDHCAQCGLPVRYAAEKFVEHDEKIAETLGVHSDDVHVIGEIVKMVEEESGYPGEVLLAMERYRFVDELCAQYVHFKAQSPEQERTDAIDRVVTHKVWGIPLFIVVMAAVFWLTFAVIGGPLQEVLEEFFDWAGGAIGEAMLGAGLSSWIYDLCINGVWAGVCSVLSFLPIICVLFFFLSFLEDSGYMTRVSFLMDELLRRIGLSGRSFVPLIVGFGCNVPAVMATRTLPSERDRKLTVLLAPFMSCSAKLPVYGMICGAFFGTNATLAMISLYVLGIVVALLLGLLLSKTLFKGDAMMYVTELPPYRLPALSDVLRHMWLNAKEFVKKAFTIIFAGTVIIWFLQSFDTSFNPVTDSSSSILAVIGTDISFIFAPIGLDSWQATTALLSGLAAKEAIVSTLAVLMGGAETALAASLGTIFTPLTAYTFLAFILLYIPCLATFAATRKELGSTLQALGAVCMQLVVAYAVSFLIYNGGLLLGF